jgi:hypothetical protein
MSTPTQAELLALSPEEAWKLMPKLIEQLRQLEPMETATSSAQYPIIISRIQTLRTGISDTRERYLLHTTEKLGASTQDLQTHTKELLKHAQRLNKLTLILIGVTISLAIITAIDIILRLLHI